MCDATVSKFVRLNETVCDRVWRSFLPARIPPPNRSNAPLFPGFFAPRLYRRRQVRAYCIIRVVFAHYPDKHSPYFQAGFGLMVSKNSAKRAYICGMAIHP